MTVAASQPIPAANEELLALLRRHRLLAIVRGDDPDHTLRSLDVLVGAGVPLVEVSLTGKGALDAIARATREFGDAARIGAGTVLTEELAERSAEAGATYAVTPGLGPGVGRCVELGLPVLAGVLTPTEVVAARLAGAAAAKLFPAGNMGVEYLRALRAPFPDTPFVPVGGVGVPEAQAFLAAGAIAVGVGSPLLGDAPAGGDLAELRLRAEKFVAAVASDGRSATASRH